MRERDPRSKWLVGCAEIAAFAGRSIDDVGAALRSGELRGNQRKAGAVWRTHVEWVDAWNAGEEPQSITGRRTA